MHLYPFYLRCLSKINDNLIRTYTSSGFLFNFCENFEKEDYPVVWMLFNIPVSRRIQVLEIFRVENFKQKAYSKLYISTHTKEIAATDNTFLKEISEAIFDAFFKKDNEKCT